jgi:hypothetical protein
MYRNELFENLRELDADLAAKFGYAKHFEMTIAGSGALIMPGYLSSERATTDIDVLEASLEIEEFLWRYGMNSAISSFSHEFPDGWQKRKVKTTFEGYVLDVFIMSVEDMVIAKLRAFRPQDQSDLNGLLAKKVIDYDKLDKIVSDPTELQINLDTEIWDEFLGRYKQFLETRTRDEQDTV